MADKELVFRFSAEGLQEIAQQVQQFTQQTTGASGGAPSSAPMIAAGSRGGSVPLPAAGSGAQVTHAATSRGLPPSPAPNPNGALPGGYSITAVNGGFQVTSASGNVLGTYNQQTAYGLVSTLTGQAVSPPPPGGGQAVSQQGLNHAANFAAAFPNGGRAIPSANQAIGYSPYAGAYPTAGFQPMGTAAAVGAGLLLMNQAGAVAGNYLSGQPMYPASVAAQMLGSVPFLGAALGGWAETANANTRLSAYAAFGGARGLVPGDFLAGEANFLGQAALHGFSPGRDAGGTKTSYDLDGPHLRMSGWSNTAIFDLIRRQSVGRFGRGAGVELETALLQEALSTAMDGNLFSTFGYSVMDNPRALLGQAAISNPFSPLLGLSPGLRFESELYAKQNKLARGFGLSAQNFGALAGFRFSQGNWRAAQTAAGLETFALQEQQVSLGNQMGFMRAHGLGGTADYQNLMAAFTELTRRIQEVGQAAGISASQMREAGQRVSNLELGGSAQISLMSGVGGGAAAGFSASVMRSARGNVNAARANLDRLRALPGMTDNAPAILAARAELVSAQIQSAQTDLDAATAPISARLRQQADTLQTGLVVSNTTFASYADRRGLLEGSLRNMGAQVNEVQSYWTRYVNEMKAAGKAITPEQEARHQMQINSLVREAAGIQSDLETGWLDRLVSRTWNAPSNFNLVASGFTRREASLFFGIQTRAFGGNAASSDYYRRQVPLRYASPGMLGSSEGMMNTAAMMGGGAAGTFTIKVIVEQPGKAPMTTMHAVQSRHDTQSFDRGTQVIKVSGGQHQ